MSCLIRVSEFIKRVYGDASDGATPPTPQTITRNSSLCFQIKAAHLYVFFLLKTVRKNL